VSIEKWHLTLRVSERATLLLYVSLRGLTAGSLPRVNARLLAAGSVSASLDALLSQQTA